MPLRGPLQRMERHQQREDRMGDAFLLGAGFSKAVYPAMPPMRELFELLKRKFRYSESV